MAMWFFFNVCYNLIGHLTNHEYNNPTSIETDRVKKYSVKTRKLKLREI